MQNTIGLLSFLVSLYPACLSFCADVSSVDSEKMSLVVTTTNTERFARGDKICVGDEGAYSACGAVTKTQGRKAFVKLDYSDGNIVPGQRATLVGRDPAAAVIQTNAIPDEVARIHRAKKRFGVYLSLLGDPFPSIWGLNVGYNVTPFARMTAGFATLGSITTYGGGMKLFLPSSNFSPVVAINYAVVSLQIDTELFKISKSGGIAYATMGFDYQSRGGFNVSAGVNSPLGPFIPIPFVNLGWFFI